MCLLCVISRWSRRVATMLPWLVVPFIIVWALSQLLPPSYRLEVTSSRLACLGVLLSSLVWYELLMPWLSSWRAHRNALRRERKLIEAQEAAKWRKEATRKCRNCLAAYKVQTPGSGRFVCTYCGHTSKRPMLEVPGASASIRSDGLPPYVSGKGGMWHSRAPCEGNAIIWSRDAERNHCAWFGDSLSGGDKCSAGHAYPYPLFLVLRVLSLLWQIVRGLKHSSTYGARNPQRTLNSEVAVDENKNEKARKKADKKKQARLLKELLEAEDKKQREEVALLVEEQRRQRHVPEVAMQREEGAAAETEMKIRPIHGEQKEQIGKSRRKVKESVTVEPVLQSRPENAAQVESKATGKVGGKVIGSIAGTKGSGGAPQDNAFKHKNTRYSLAHNTFMRNHGTRAQRVFGSPNKIGPYFEGNGSRRDRIDDPVAGRSMQSSRGPSSSSKAEEHPGPSGSSWTKAPWICALLKGSKALADERSKSNTPLNSVCEHRKGVDQGTMDGLKLFNGKTEPPSQSEESTRADEDGSLGAGDSMECSDYSSMALKSAKSPEVSASGWKQAPWISGWARGTKGISEKGKTQVESAFHSGKGQDHVMDGGLNSFNNDASVIKRPYSPVKGTAIHPPIAPPSTHVDPLQQLFSTPSLFEPMLLPVDLNSSQADRNVQTDRKALCLQGHSFFEAQKHPQLVDSLASHFTSQSEMHMHGPKSSFMDSVGVGMQGSMPLDASSEMHMHGPKSAFMESDGVAMQGFVPSDALFETAGFTIQAPLQSPPIPKSLLETTKVDSCNPINEKEALSQLDEEALQLPPFSTVQSLFDSEMLTLDSCLLSPVKGDKPNVKEDILLDEVHCADQKSLWADFTAVLNDSDSGHKVPAEFVDCITQEIMEDPVITADGHSYERSAIEKWLKNHDTSPKTGEVLPPPPGSSGVDKTLRPNHILRGQILEYKEKLARMSGLRTVTWSMTSKDMGSVFHVTSSPSVLSF